MLQNIRAELPQKLAILVIDLNLVSRRPLRHHNVPTLLHHTHSVRVQQLSVPLATLAELELEPTVLVEDLDAVRVRIGHNDVVVRVDGDPAGLRELAVVDAELAELAVVDHLGASELRAG